MTVMSEIIEVGDIIQMVPAHRWAGCLAVTEDIRSWGVVAYMQLPGPPGMISGVTVVIPENRAYIRLSWEDFTLTGGKVLVEK